MYLNLWGAESYEEEQQQEPKPSAENDKHHENLLNRYLQSLSNLLKAKSQPDQSCCEES